MKRRDFLAGVGLLVSGLASANNESNDKKLNVKKIHLTIDDGPLKSMPKMLEILGVEKNPVIFYLIGQNIEHGNGMALARQAVINGHVLGNHSYSHPMFSTLSLDSIKREVEKTELLIEQVYQDAGIAQPGRFFRFPYGDPGFYVSKKSGVHGNRQKKKDIAKFLKQEGFTTQFWNVDSCDWRYYSKKSPLSISTIMKYCRRAQDGDIVLVHDRPMTAREIVPFYVSSLEFKLVLPD